MLMTAVADIGLSPSEFWELSWYDWGLYLLRYENRIKKEKQEYENGWEQIRILWATLINVGSGKGKSVKPSDLIKLSYDGKAKEDDRPKPGEVIERFKAKLKK
jgi:hypothetical protein